MPRLISPMITKEVTVREGYGFSGAELKEAGLTVTEARRIGLPVDQRRKSSHPENVEILKEWAASAAENHLKVEQPKQKGKGQKSRADRALTSSGQKLRGLVRGKGKN
jgi:large subunit ribosomal protein L13e